MRKKIIYGLVMPLLAVILVTAGLIAYYGQIQTTIDVNQPVEVNGGVEHYSEEKFTCDAGDTCDGHEIIIENTGDDERTVVISNDAVEEEVEVSYISDLNLAQKIVNFNLDKWDLLPDGKTAVVKYTIVGDSFTAEIKAGELKDYVLVYYKDNSNRFNSPATAIGINSIVGNLAYEDDANNDEYDYCATKEYVTCHGAKIWYIPSNAVDGLGNINWGLASGFLFETKLIQFNSDGEIVIYGGNSLTITPRYTLDAGLNETEQVITTTIDVI